VAARLIVVAVERKRRGEEIDEAREESDLFKSCFALVVKREAMDVKLTRKKSRTGTGAPV